MKCPFSASHAFARARYGGVAVVGALTITSLLGMAGLSLDLGSAYVQRAKLQKVADSAAMAGAVSYVKNGSTAVVVTVTDVVKANGLATSVIQTGNTGVTTSSSSPNPSSCSGTTPCVRVNLSAPLSLTLLRVIVPDGSLTTGANAWAKISTGGGGGQGVACMLALQTLTVSANITAPNCWVAANGTGNQAINVNGGKLTAYGINTPGGVWVDASAAATMVNATLGVLGNNKAGVTGATVNKVGVRSVPDPYSSYQSIATSGLNGGYGTCMSYSGQNPLNPGCWNNVNLNSGVNLSLKAGTFFFTGMNMNSGSTLTGTGGVTIVMGQSFSPNGNITLTAPNTGSGALMPGVAIYLKNGMNANSSITYNVSGAVYSPNSTMIPNSGTWNQNACTYLVAQNIQANGGSSFTLPQTNCGSYSFPTGPVGGSGGSPTIALVK